MLRGILVEGTDCSGKSSLVKRLKAELGTGWDVLQMSHKDGDQFKRYLKVYLEAERLLIDRGHFSEVVYGDLLRGGRHFEQWQKRVLDDLARDEFATVLCTAPPELLWERHRNRDTAMLLKERRYIEGGGGPQPAMSFDDFARAQAAFAEAVGPQSTAVYESDRAESLEHTIRALAVRLGRQELWRGAKSLRNPALPDLVVMEGSGPRRSAVAHRLAESLGGWGVTTLSPSPNGGLFRELLSRCVCASRTVIDASQLTADPGQLHETMDVYRYVASRGAVVVCGTPGSPADDATRALLRNAGVRYRDISEDSADAVGEIAAWIQNRVSFAEEA